MAKLNGVQVIDMVGGEVTKIAYEGEEYAKVDGDGKTGDIAIVTKPWGTIKVGDTFSVEEVYSLGSRSRTYVRLKGDEVVGRVDDVDYFRKTSAQPTLTDRVDELETRVSALEEGGKATESLIGKFAKFNRNFTDVTKGEYYEIVDTDEGGVTIFDDVGDRQWWDYPNDDYEIVDEKPSQVIEGDPQVGDKIRIVNAWMAFGEYENGDILTVRKVDSDKDVRVEEHGVVIYRKEFEIIERNPCVSHARPEKAEKAALKVGDYAKVVDATPPFSKVGQIVIISEDDESGIPYKTESLSGEYTGWYYKDDIVKATDEEVAEAKRKLAEEQEAEAEAKKWAEIGRKPNEFKSGDIVRVTTCSYGGHNVGTIGELVDELSWEGTHRVMANGEVYSQDYELITPVEHRFDR